MTRPASSLLFSLRKLSFAVIAGALLAALSACSSAPPLFLSDGRPTVQLQCPVGDQNSCAQQARVRCGGDYDTVSTSTSSDGTTFNLVFACRAH